MGPVAAANPDVAAVLQFLQSGRHALREAPEHFGRALGPADYFWLAVCLGALVLAHGQQRPNVAGRLEALAEAFGRQGPSPDLEEALRTELAILDGLGLLWPLCRREQGQWVRDPAVPLAPAFGPEDAYWLSVAHVAVALLAAAGRAGEAGDFSRVIGELVTTGLQPAHERAILDVIGSIPPGEA